MFLCIGYRYEIYLQLTGTALISSDWNFSSDAPIVFTEYEYSDAPDNLILFDIQQFDGVSHTTTRNFYIDALPNIAATITGSRITVICVSHV